ncbi:hypothetical protein FACS1894187_02250 [Synergistales bacterium]|nr:hypothetical protein FACS1894187_02250 [Synergistales bacterium]
MRKREAIQPRNYIKRKPMYSFVQQAAMSHSLSESEQLPSGSKSVREHTKIIRAYLGGLTDSA